MAFRHEHKLLSPSKVNAPPTTGSNGWVQLPEDFTTYASLNSKGLFFRKIPYIIQKKKNLRVLCT